MKGADYARLCESKPSNADIQAAHQKVKGLSEESIIKKSLPAAVALGFVKAVIEFYTKTDAESVEKVDGITYKAQ